MNKQKLLTLLICLFLPSILLIGCGKSDKCPICSEKVDFSKDIICSNCGFSFTSTKPDGYYETPTIQTSEEKGVPDEIIRKNFESFYKNTEYANSYHSEISHDVNTTTHIDTVTVTLTASSKYGKETYQKIFEYQYDRSSDLWSFMSEGEWDGTFDPNADAFIGTWELYYEDYYYLLCFEELSDSGATLTYNDVDEGIYLENEFVEFEPNAYPFSKAGLLLDRGQIIPFAYLDIDGLHSGLFSRPFEKAY